MEPHWPYEPHEGITDETSKVALADDVLGFRAVNGNIVLDPVARARAWAFSESEQKRLADLYDGEVRYLDGRLAELFAALETRGALTNTIVVVTSDHGEELGEHAIFGHGASLYESEIHVPLIVHVPGGQPAHVTQPVETAGIAAALVRAVGLEPPATFQVAPVPLHAGAGPPSPPVSQLAKIANFALWLHRTAVIEDDRKLLVAGDGASAAYDIRADPGERTLLAPTADEVARLNVLDRYDQFAARPRTPVPMDPETLARLRGLGYVGTP
jgi:arylsulfatase A-like enzyme